MNNLPSLLKTLFAVCVLTMTAATVSATDYYFFTKSGDYTNPSNWSGGNYPGTNITSSMIVYIRAACTVYTNITINGDLIIDPGKSLTNQNGSMTVDGYGELRVNGTMTNKYFLTIKGNGKLMVSGTFKHQTTLPLKVYGTVTTTGTFQFDSGEMIVYSGGSFQVTSNTATFKGDLTNHGIVSVYGTLKTMNYGEFDHQGSAANIFGTLDIEGNLKVSSGKTLEIKSGGYYNHNANNSTYISGSITNFGTMTLYSGKNLIINPGGSFICAKTAKIYGNLEIYGSLTVSYYYTMTIQSGGSLYYDGTSATIEGTLNNSGTVTIKSGNTMVIATAGLSKIKNYNKLYNYGTLTINGQLLNTGTLNNYGKFNGNGVVNGNYSGKTSSTIAPGTSPGCLQFWGSFSLNGKLRTELADGSACSSYDQVKVTGNANISGTINILFPGGAPTDSTFTILTATGTISGTPTITWPSGYSGTSAIVAGSPNKFQVTIMRYWYADSDGDGYGNPAVSIQAASQPAGYVLSNTDCDDTNAAINPAATEVCDGIDNDCDGQVDEGLVQNYYADADGDGYGDPATTQYTCSPPTGYVTNNTDCDDSNSAINPGATEVCDGVDNDCDGQVDEGFAQNYYADSDGDGYGDPNTTLYTCTPPSGYVTDNTDCDDTNAAINPGATEVCDGLDNDCDGLLDTADPGFVDTTPPVVTCKDITVTLDASNSANIAPADVHLSSSDDCGTVNLVSVSPNTFSCAETGANTVTLTVNDGNGNSNTCTATVTVVDGEVPSITCPAAVSVSADAGTCEATNVAIGNATGSDNCGAPTISNDAPSTFPAGSTSVIWTADDGNGNTASCSQTVAVTDDEVPTVTCKNHTASLDANGSASIVPADVYDSGSDNCGTVNLVSVSPNSFNCNDIGTHTVTLTVNDGNGNSTICTATVTVADNMVPSAVCQNITVQLAANGEYTLTTGELDDGSTDNCGSISLAITGGPNPVTCAHVDQTVPVTLTATDGEGNSASCTANITVKDDNYPCNEPPVAVCQNLSVSADGNCQAVVPASDFDDGSSDPDNDPLTFAASPASPYPLGTTTVTLTVSDPYGETDQCTANITVSDNTPPAVTCKAHTAVLNASGSAPVIPADVYDSGSDNCGTVNLVSVSPSNFNCVNIGTNTVVLTANDGHGNTATCTATVIVEDNTPPTVTCKPHTAALDATGHVNITQTDVHQSSSDNCGTVNLVSVLPNSFNCNDIGTHTVTLTVNDGNSNANTCTATVTVADNTAPSVVCKSHTAALDANGSASVAPADVYDSGSDNCGTVNLVSVAPATFDCSNIGANTVVLTVNDGHGNTATCTATVTVADNTAPSVVCKSHTAALDANGSASVAPADVYDSGSDNCGTVNLVSVAPATFDCSNIGINAVVLTVNDGHGNTATCNATVTVEDNLPPTAACLSPTVYLDVNGQVIVTTADVFDTTNSSDNCGSPYAVSVTPESFDCSNLGTNTVTLQIIDLHGNTALCTATVTVEDNINPTVTCKNTSVTLNSQGQANLQPIEVYDNGSDNCGNVSLQSVSPNSFDCSHVGANTVTLTVNDGNGNTGTCTATVTINDNIGPTAVCKNIILALDNNGAATISAADVDDGSSDNCGIGSMSVSPSSFGCANVGANTVTLSVTDDNGSSATCTATVTIEDNTAPTALCQNFTTDLDSDGNYTLAPTSVDNGSSDACGLSLSVSPNQFDCSGIGANTVTLTATDDNGNTATCTATLTINTFLTISNVIITHESCLGYGDGQIEIIAAATGGGQLRYSIDGGTSFQLTNIFSNLSPNTYDIVVELSGNGSCSATSSAVIDPGSSQQTWYKDLDGDGYTDGITQVSCSAPAGYVASAIPGDCDDNDATVNPGAPELCNGLDDNCDGIIPADEQDNDADGYRICDGDCDDTDPAINPGATEICNNIDDDCDGLIDEGVAYGTEVYVGNVTFTSQAAVDNFSQCYYKIQGNLTITGTGINSLANLSNLQEVTGNVLIQVTSLPNMNGLDALTTIGGSLTIKLNNYGAKLTSLSGLGNLTSIGQNLNISFNFNLSDCCSIDDLLANAGVGGATIIFNNASGCNSVSDISNSCGGGSIIILPGNGIAFGETAEQPRMSLFPNPATSEVTILLEGLEVSNDTKVQLYDQFGRLAHTLELAEGQEVATLQINANELPTGVYQVVLKTSTTQLVERLIIKN